MICSDPPIYRGLNGVLARQPKLNLERLDRLWIDRAHTAAGMSDVPQFHMAALIVNRKGNFVCAKTNSIGRHHIQTRWRPITTHVHAEIACLIETTRSQTRDATIYVARNRRNRTYACSYPCHGCMNALLSTKIRWLVCRDEQEQIVRIDLQTV